MEEISLLYNNKKILLEDRARNKHPKELKELKGTSLAKRRKEVIMQTFPCFMQSVPMFERKSGNALQRESLRLPQMPDNGLHFWL